MKVRWKRIRKTDKEIYYFDSRQAEDAELCGRLLQIGAHRKIREQQAGKHNGKLQDRAQNILQPTRPLCSRNSINACRAAFKSS